MNELLLLAGIAGYGLTVTLLAVILSSAITNRELQEKLKASCGRGCASCKINKCLKK